MRKRKEMKKVKDSEIEFDNFLNPRFYSGVNEVCKQCLNDCKQFKKVVLISCPKIKLAKKLNK